MRPLPDLAVWGLAAAASLAIHGALAAWLILLPAPDSTARGETTIAIHSLTSGLPQSVNIGTALRPVDDAATVAVEGGAAKRIAEPHGDGGNADILRPADTASAALSPTVGTRAIGGTERRSVHAAAISESKVVASSAVTSRAAEPVPTEVSPALGSSSAGRHAQSSTTASANARRVDQRAPALSSKKVEAAQAAQSLPPRVAAPIPEQPDDAAPIATSPERIQPSPVPAEQKVFARAPPPTGSDAVSYRADTPAVAAGEAKVVAPTESEKGSAQSVGSSSGAAEAVAVVVPPKPLPPARVREVDPYVQVLEYLAGHEANKCFLALPSAGNGGRVKIDGFAISSADVSRFAAELKSLTGVEVEPRAHAVSPDQCRALSFARGLAAYPIADLSIRLAARSIRSGTFLSGEIDNLRHRMLYLIVIDDEGKVQEIDGLFQKTAGEIGFDAPMTLTGGAVETVQLLIAVASDAPLATFASHEGEKAETYFAALAEEIGRTGAAVDFGFTFFFVD